MTLKVKRHAAAKGRGKGASTTHVSYVVEQIPLKDERVKTSIVVQRSILLQMQRLANRRGLSLNGSINLALFQWVRTEDGWTPALATPASGAVLHTAVEAAVARRPPATNGRGKKIRARMPSSMSEGFTRPAEGPDDVACFVDWGTLNRYADLNVKYSTYGPQEMAKKMGISIEEALAADIGMQTPEYERWLRQNKRVRKA